MEAEETISEFAYSDRVFNLLINVMGPGSEFSIAEKVHPENRATFIEAVKLFIECDYGRKLGGFYIEFSSDYSKIRKLNYF